MNKLYRKLIIINVVFLTFVALVLWQVGINEQKLQEASLTSEDVTTVIASSTVDIRNASVQLPVPPSSTAIISTTTPTTLFIPSIGLMAHVQNVGRTKSGNMAVPNNFTDVGWYRYGPTPGAVGNAVIAGHLDNGRGVHAVFYNLNKLKVGDTIYTSNSAGKVVMFSVTEVALYDYNNAPLDKIFGKSDSSHLNLITCDGTWVQEKRSYDKRLVIYSEVVKNTKENVFF